MFLKATGAIMSLICAKLAEDVRVRALGTLRDETEDPIRSSSNSIGWCTNTEWCDFRIVQEWNSNPGEAEEGVEQENACDGDCLGSFTGTPEEEGKHEETGPLASSSEHQHFTTADPLDEDDGEEGEQEVLRAIGPS